MIISSQGQDEIEDRKKTASEMIASPSLGSVDDGAIITLLISEIEDHSSLAISYVWSLILKRST